MLKWIRAPVQVLLYGGFAVALAVFSNRPVYQHMDSAAALIKLSFSHATQRREPCRTLSADELSALAPNMRRPLDCARERVDLRLALRVDDELLYDAALPPSGLARDGEATVYRKFVVEPGAHTVTLAMRDSPRQDGYDYTVNHDVELAPGQLLVIDFDAGSGGFKFR